MIKIDVRGLDVVKRKLDAVPRELRDKVLQPAINKVADKTGAEINRAITDEYAVKAAEVRNAISIRRAGQGRIEAVITVFGSKSRRGRSMNLIHFLAAINAVGRAVKARGAKVNAGELAALKAQLGFRIKRAGGLKKIEGAFVGNKGRTVFRRTGKSRLPIEPVQVIGFSQMFNSRKISTRVHNKITQELPIEVDRAIKRLGIL